MDKKKSPAARQGIPSQIHMQLFCCQDALQGVPVEHHQEKGRLLHGVQAVPLQLPGGNCQNSVRRFPAATLLAKKAAIWHRLAENSWTLTTMGWPLLFSTARCKATAPSSACSMPV